MNITYSFTEASYLYIKITSIDCNGHQRGCNFLMAVFIVSIIQHANIQQQTLSFFFLPYVSGDNAGKELRCIVMLNTYRYDGLQVGHLAYWSSELQRNPVLKLCVFFFHR